MRSAGDVARLRRGARTGLRHRGGPAPHGTLVVARDEDEARELERQLAFREGLGLRAVRMRASEARAREPALAPTVRLALHAPEDHSVDPRLVVAALRAACEQAGVRLCEYTPVRGLELDVSQTRVLGVAGGAAGTRRGRQCRRGRRGGRGWFGEDGAYESVYAGEVVVAMGAWSGGLEGLPEGAGCRCAL